MTKPTKEPELTNPCNIKLSKIYPRPNWESTPVRDGQSLTWSGQYRTASWSSQSSADEETLDEYHKAPCSDAIPKKIDGSWWWVIEIERPE